MIILDTNVISDMIGPAPSPAVAAWVFRQPPGDMFVSAVTEAELRYGVEIMPQGRRRDRYLAEIDGLLHAEFAGRILPFDSVAAQTYATIVAARRAAGRPIAPFDCQIAAIARSLAASVATRDAGGFEGCGIDVIDPWTD